MDMMKSQCYMTRINMPRHHETCFSRFFKVMTKIHNVIYYYYYYYYYLHLVWFGFFKIKYFENIHHHHTCFVYQCMHTLQTLMHAFIKV